MVECVLYQNCEVIARKQFASKADALRWISQTNFEKDQFCLIRQVESIVCLGMDTFGDFEYA